VQEEQIELRQAQALQAGLDRAAQDCFDLGWWWIAQVALAGDADPGWQPCRRRSAAPGPTA
jgi:hypothetical protein